MATNTGLNGLERRKQELIAESENNRLALAEEYEVLVENASWVEQGYNFYENVRPALGPVASIFSNFTSAGRTGGILKTGLLVGQWLRTYWNSREEEQEEQEETEERSDGVME